jgi:hypothetical protein
MCLIHGNKRRRNDLVFNVENVSLKFVDRWTKCMEFNMIMKEIEIYVIAVLFFTTKITSTIILHVPSYFC